MRRDKEFLAAKDLMTPILNKKFHFLLKRMNTRVDRKSLVEDLVALTICEALRNSRKEIHSDISCEQLIRIKAKNVWADYCKERFASFNHSEHALLEWEEDLPYEEVDKNEKIALLLAIENSRAAKIMQGRLDGYKNWEIAAMLGVTEGAIEQQILRLKQKIRSRS